jgi:hypothetical protein
LAHDEKYRTGILKVQSENKEHENLQQEIKTLFSEVEGLKKDLNDNNDELASETNLVKNLNSS